MSGTYARPNDAPVSSSWDDHKNRNPPSAEPGTDYACAYGTDLAMAGDGTVSVVDTSPGGGEGRRMSVDLDDGRRVSYIHLDSINAWVGMRVGRGQTGVAISGASGNGSSWYYGPHVHSSLWERPGMSYADTIDFDQHVGSGPDIDSEDEMIKISAPNRGIAIVGPGYYKSLTPEEAAHADAICSKSADGNDRQFDLWRQMAIGGVVTYPATMGGPTVVFGGVNRGTALVDAGYYKSLTQAEADAVRAITDRSGALDESAFDALRSAVTGGIAADTEDDGKGAER